MLEAAPEAMLETATAGSFSHSALAVYSLPPASLQGEDVKLFDMQPGVFPSTQKPQERPHETSLTPERVWDGEGVRASRVSERVWNQ